MTSRKVLYFCVPDAEVPELNPIQERVVDIWGGHPTWLFSVSQVVHWTGAPRRKIRRAIERMVKMGIVERHCGGYKG